MRKISLPFALVVSSDDLQRSGGFLRLPGAAANPITYFMKYLLGSFNIELTF